MKKVLLIISSVLLVISILGLVKVYRLPVQVDSKQDVTLLNYQHEGTFSPHFYVDPSYVAGDYTDLPSNPRYPTQFLENIGVTFSYVIPVTQVQDVEVTALLSNPGVWEKSYEIVPRVEKSGNFDLNFTIDVNQYLLLGENIDAEIGVVSREYQLIIMTNIHVPDACEQLHPDFKQDLVMNLGPDFVEVSQDTSRRWGEALGQYSYTVSMKSNSLYNGTDIVVTPVPAPREVDGGDNIFSNLAETMVMDFSYELQSSSPITDLVEDVTLESTVENMGKWSKPMVLVPSTVKEGAFSVTIPLDLVELRQEFVNIGQETGMYAQNYNFTIKANVHATGETEFGSIDETFTQSATLDVSAGQLKWSGQMSKVQPGTIRRTDTIQEINMYWKFPVADLRIAFIVLTAIFAGLFILALYKITRDQSGQLTAVEIEVRRITKKYKGIIADIQELPGLRDGDVVIKTSSIDELVKTAEGLIKPVLHSKEQGKHVYIVLDEMTRYQYEILSDEEMEATHVIELTED